MGPPGRSIDPTIPDEPSLGALAVALGGPTVGGALSSGEAALLRQVARASPPEKALVSRARADIRLGLDPLGDLFCSLRATTLRRASGAFYTPFEIVRPMVSWVLRQEPTRIIDPGCGSGRFALEARRQGFRGKLLAIDKDPLATLLTRANLAAEDVKWFETVGIGNL
jgi:SAM-dependent methyltransferase